MAQLNFPDPADAQTYTNAGITWTWNASLGVWSTDAQDGFTQGEAENLFLKLDTTNDPLTGDLTIGTSDEITLNADGSANFTGDVTFEGVTTHEAGLVTQNTTVQSVNSTIQGTNLSFYEQGTFTPTNIVKDNGFKESGGQNAGWGSVQTTAEYTRIGNICFFRVSFNNVSNNGTSGITPSNTQMTFKGLPFPPTGLTHRIPLSASISNNTSYSSAQLCAYIKNDGGTAQVLLTGSTLSNSSLSYNVVGTSNRINVSGHYMIEGA